MRPLLFICLTHNRVIESVKIGKDLTPAFLPTQLFLLLIFARCVLGHRSRNPSESFLV